MAGWAVFYVHVVVHNAVWSAGILPCEVGVLCVRWEWEVGDCTLYVAIWAILCDEYENVQYFSAFESAFDCIE